VQGSPLPPAAQAIFFLRFGWIEHRDFIFKNYLELPVDLS
jgi:hypothetical protein